MDGRTRRMRRTQGPGRQTSPLTCPRQDLGCNVPSLSRRQEKQGVGMLPDSSFFTSASLRRIGSLSARFPMPIIARLTLAESRPSSPSLSYLVSATACSSAAFCVSVRPLTFLITLAGLGEFDVQGIVDLRRWMASVLPAHIRRVSCCAWNAFEPAIR